MPSAQGGVAPALLTSGSLLHEHAPEFCGSYHASTPAHTLYQYWVAANAVLVMLSMYLMVACAWLFSCVCADFSKAYNIQSCP